MPEVGDQVNWRECNLVEVIPGKVSGAPLLKGTRMPAQTIADNIDYGMTVEKAAETWQLDPKVVLAIWKFAGKQRANPSR